MDERERLRSLIVRHAIRRGTFTLASGRTSDWYLDCRKVTLHPEGAWLIGRLMLATIREKGWLAEAIGGLTLGADPIAGAVAAVSHAEGTPIGGFLVRKAAKEHGTRQRIEGTPVEGKSVVVVDDVVTTGGSTLEAIAAVREAGGRVAGIIVVVDRDEGGSEGLREYPYAPLFRRGDLLDQGAP